MKTEDTFCESPSHDKSIKRTRFIARLAALTAALPAASMLLASPAMETTQSEGEYAAGVFEGETTEVVQVGPEGTSHLFAGMFDGRYMTSMFRSGFPTQAVMQWARDNGFDRFEVWNNGKAIFQDTLTAGKLPVGWDTLEYAGHL